MSHYTPTAHTEPMNFDHCYRSWVLRLVIIGLFVVACDADDPPVDVCGDTIVDPGETCDDGNDVAGDGCSACALEPRCGDHVLDHITGEQCDDGNTVSGDGCSELCQREAVPN